ILRRLAEALAYAHGKRLYHRALSPHSVVAVPSKQPGGGAAAPEVRIFNWQMAARALASRPATRPRTRTVSLHPDELVESAALVYVAPELLTRAEVVDEAADVFSLGAIAFHLFA